MVTFNECNTHTTKQHRTTAKLSMKNLISGFQVIKKTKQKKEKQEERRDKSREK
jgi:hypothetical protein